MAPLSDPAEGACRFTIFTDRPFSLNDRIVTYYIKQGSDILGVQTSVNMAILERFNAEGLEFAFATQTICTLPVAGGSG